jgi:GNAT superfamily N-acetyltransferase
MATSPITIRLTRSHEDMYLKKWLSEPMTLRWFPMSDEREIDDAVRFYMVFAAMGACLTAEWLGIPCGMANLYISSFKKLSHQCLFSIIVGNDYRNKGVGSALIDELEKLAKEKFQIEFLHLEVYDGNPAYRLYKRKGFVEYGKQSRFINEDGVFIDKILMQKKIV